MDRLACKRSLPSSLALEIASVPPLSILHIALCELSRRGSRVPCKKNREGVLYRVAAAKQSSGCEL